MPVFVAIAKSGVPSVQAKIDENFKESSYPFKSDTWVIDAALTTNEVAEKLGIRTGDTDATGLVVPITSYSGWAENDLWEWLKLHWPKAA